MPIFDQGYQHWQGPLTGHGWRWLAIARHGVRVQLHSRTLRLLLLLAWVPALALVAAVSLWGLVEQQSQGVLGLVSRMLPADILLEPRAYRTTAWTLAYSFFFKAEMFFIMLLVVTAGPSLISADLRFNALPLYFARPLTRLDYFLGKLGVIAALVAAVAVVPAVFAYLVGVIFSLDLGVVADTYPVLLGSAAYGVLITLSAGTFMLALSSLSRRSLYVGIAWFGVWWVSNGVAGMLTGLQMESVRRDLLQQELEKARAAADGEPKGPGGKNKARAAAWQRSRERMEEVLAENAQYNWRLLLSYTANLERLGEGLLRTDAAWVQIGRAVDKTRQIVPFGRAPAAPANERRFADRLVPQFPWTWSAGVLLALLGISVWTLTRRVRSLDQLR
jgi:ABC-2 type transport system permease protein